MGCFHLYSSLIRRIGILMGCICFSALLNSIQAQTSIQGTITDRNNKPLADANVLLLKASDSSLVKGAVSSGLGQYRFEQVPQGRYLIAVSFAGFQKNTGNAFDVRQAAVERDTIKLTETEVELREVTVTAKKPLFEQKMDRMVVNVASSITAAGSTALEVLERSPGIRVDRQNNTLSMNSKEGVIIMINGKINRMPITAVVQMLAAMPSSNIERIELITTPPANFDAEGNAGYINLVLKQNTLFGTNGNYTITGGFSRGLTSEASMNFNHRSNRLNLFGDFSYSRNESEQIFSFSRIINFQGKTIESGSSAYRNFTRIFTNGQLGLDYELNPKTTIGVLVSAYDNLFKMESNNPGTVVIDKRPDTLFTLSNKEKNDWFNYSANLNLQHIFKPGEKLTVNADYIHYNNSNPVDYANTFNDGTNNFLYRQELRSRKETPISVWVGSTDYAKDISKKVNMESGLKATVSRFDNNVEVAYLRAAGWENDKALTAKFNLSEKILAAYTTMGVVLNEKSSIKAGLRYEYTRSNLDSDKRKNIVDRRYGLLFPSFYYSLNMNENNAFNFSYSRRITRPTFNDMAPFVIFMDPYTFFSGNPALQPAITNAASVSYTYKRKTLILSYSYQTDPITNFAPKVDSITNITTLAAENQKSNQVASITLSVPVQVNKWWSMQNNALGSWQKLDGTYLGAPFNITLSNFSFNSTQSFKLPKDFAFEAVGFFQSAGIFGIYKVKPVGGLNLGLMKSLPKIKSTLRVNGNNVLNSLVFKPSVNLPDQNLNLWGSLRFAYPAFRITFSHRFGSDNLKEKRARVTGSEEERSRVQQ